MRDSIEVTGIGIVHLTKPRSFVAISDLNCEWWAAHESDSRAKLARLVAAGIGLAWDRSKGTHSPPVYDVTAGDVVGYGATMLDWMLKNGAVPSSIYLQRDVVDELWAILPKEAEVAAATDSFPDNGRGPGSGGAEDSEAVESAA
jgi:hypothetical protein